MTFTFLVNREHEATIRAPHLAAAWQAVEARFPYADTVEFLGADN